MSIRACLMGGALGDAMGAEVEFWSLQAIERQHGPGGVKEPQPDGRGKLRVTDDTQLTLFTGEGLLLGDMWDAYQRWLYTQGEIGSPPPPSDIHTSWLLDIAELKVRRAPGTTCLNALLAPRPEEVAQNNSKGCGGIMRVAPIACAVARKDVFSEACHAAALTHGHPTGYLAAGYFAVVLHLLLQGSRLPDAMEEARQELAERSGSEETLEAIMKQEALLMAWEKGALKNEVREGNQGRAIAKYLGAGWVAEEALAIALYCARVADDDAMQGLRLAINHSGDSDSTGSLTGQLLGAMLGDKAWDENLLQKIEIHGALERMAEELEMVGAPG